MLKYLLFAAIVWAGERPVSDVTIYEVKSEGSGSSACVKMVVKNVSNAEIKDLTVTAYFLDASGQPMGQGEAYIAIEGLEHRQELSALKPNYTRRGSACIFADHMDISTWKPGAFRLVITELK